MNVPFYNVKDFINDQLNKALEEYEPWLKKRGKRLKMLI